MNSMFVPKNVGRRLSDVRVFRWMSEGMSDYLVEGKLKVGMRRKRAKQTGCVKEI